MCGIGEDFVSLHTCKMMRPDQYVGLYLYLRATAFSHVKTVILKCVMLLRVWCRESSISQASDKLPKEVT